MADNIIDLVQEHIDNLKGNKPNISLEDRRERATKIVDQALRSECKECRMMFLAFWTCVENTVYDVLDKKSFAYLEKEYQKFKEELQDNEKEKAKGLGKDRSETIDEMENVFWVLEEEEVNPFRQKFLKLKP